MAAPVLVIDFGSQVTQLIARRVREAKVYCEILPFRTPVGELRKRRPAGLILSGGPSSVYQADAPRPDRGVWELGVPVLGICYGLQFMVDALGGDGNPPTRSDVSTRALRDLDWQGVARQWDDLFRALMQAAEHGALPAYREHREVAQ